MSPCLKSALVLLLVVLSSVAVGCAAKDSSLESTLARLGLSNPVPRSFRVCVSFGCTATQAVRLEAEEWGEVTALFEPRPRTARAERLAVARAVARMETLVGRKALTWDDQPENTGTGRQTHQLDCIAESVNTSVTLVLLERAGLLRFHAPGLGEKRGLGILFPHNTATLVETGDGRIWAVDSWFTANGGEAYVLPLEVWRRGWEPAP